MLNRLRAFTLVTQLGMLCVCVVLFAAGCAGTPAELDTSPPQHATTTARIKAALISEPGVDAAAVRVSVSEGQLMLDGFVSTQQERRTVVDIAGRHSKDLDVIDRIEVR